MNLAELATMGMLLAVLIGMAATTLVRPSAPATVRSLPAAHPRPPPNGGCAMTAVILPPSDTGNTR